MNISILHYEPNEHEPYNTEIFKNVSDIKIDSDGKKVSFTMQDEQKYFANHSHRIVIKIWS